MYPGKTGRDHLGLGSVSSFQILASLSPGVNVLTVHPRYYSFFVFLLYEFWQRDRPRSSRAWTQFYRPRALAYSIACHLVQENNENPISNIVGSNKVGPLIAEGRSDFDITFDYIKSPLGGYGLYYRNAMVTVDLILPGGPGLPMAVDVPTQRGEELAHAFRRAIQQTEYFQHYFDRDEGQIPRDVLRAYGEVASLDRLAGAPDHARLLAVFREGGEGAAARRETFRFFLDVAEQTDGTGVDEDGFRQLIYFGSTPAGASYRPRFELETVQCQWRMYQMREYYAYALNAMWDYLCRWGLSNSGDLRPISLDALWQHLARSRGFAAVASLPGVPTCQLHSGSDFQSLLTWLQSTVAADTNTFDSACRLDAPVQEHKLVGLTRNRGSDPEVMVYGMLTILALIYLRMQQMEPLSEAETEIVNMGQDGRLDLASFVHSLRRRITAGYTSIQEVLRWLYEDYIILQHAAVATSKLPDNTFRFRREGKRLIFYNLPNSLTFMNSRFDALSTMVNELGLCGRLSNAEHPLTALGKQWLQGE